MFTAIGVTALIEGSDWSLFSGGSMWAVLLFMAGLVVLGAAFRRPRRAQSHSLPPVTERDISPVPGGQRAVAEPRALTETEQAIEELAAERRAEREAVGRASGSAAEPGLDAPAAGAVSHDAAAFPAEAQLDTEVNREGPVER
jgi:hypothetical protein